MSATIPNVVEVNKRRYVLRSGIERYKADLAGIPFEAAAGVPDVLVPIKRFALEIGVCVRTVERRLAAANKNAEAA